MADIEGSDVKAEIQSGGSDHQILKSDPDSLGCLLAFDASGESHNFQGEWIDDQVKTHFLHKLPAALAL
jgi:hypothetical protein